MKINMLIFCCLIIFCSTCRMPSDPLGEIKIIKRLETLDTGGNCLDIDVDIEDSILVAAANYNGYYIGKLISSGGIISEINDANLIHISSDGMDNSLGDNRAQSVILSKNHDIAFIMDQYDHIWLYKYAENAIQYGPPNYLEEDCYGGTWLSISLDDRSDRVGIYTLIKHNAAEFMPYCISASDLSAIGTDQGCTDIEDYIITNLNIQNSCEDAGNFWMYPGCQVGNYSEYSTSLVWKNLEDVAFSSSSLNGEPDCEYIINQGTIAEMIYFNDGLLSMAYGELGVRVFQQTDHDACLTDAGIIELDGNSLCDEHTYPAGSENASTINYSSCCETTACSLGIGGCGWLTGAEEGFGGVFSSAGGMIPEVYIEFDTQGEVESIYSMDNTIFSGLSNSNGCLMTILGNDASIVTSIRFAIGYSIKGIHQENGLLALAAGHDGILLYHWNGNVVSFIGKIETSYANNVKVAGNIIFAATEDGIEIIQIDYTP